MSSTFRVGGGQRQQQQRWSKIRIPKRFISDLHPFACRDLLSARWCEPSLSVVDVRVGDDTAAGDADDDDGYRFGPTRFSVVPRSATGHVSIRFVPNQDANRLFELLKWAFQPPVIVANFQASEDSATGRTFTLLCRIRT